MTKNATNLQPASNPEVDPTPRRRSFTAEYKAKILAECDAATEPGQIGAILRREGLYSSHLFDWRQRRASSGAEGLKPKKKGRPPSDPTQVSMEKELERTRRELAAVKEKLRQAEVIIDAQKKLAEVLSFLPSRSNG